MSVYTTVFAGSVPVGGLVMGAIASAWGVPLALMIGALLTLAVGIGGWFWLGRIRASAAATRSAERDPGHGRHRRHRRDRPRRASRPERSPRRRARGRSEARAARPAAKRQPAARTGPSGRVAAALRPATIAA